MPIHFRCRRCRQMLTMGVRLAGSPILCPHCRGESIVPSASERDWPAEPSLPGAEVAAGAAEPPGPAAFLPMPSPASPRKRRVPQWPRPAVAAAVLAVLALLGGLIADQVWPTAGEVSAEESPQVAPAPVEPRVAQAEENGQTALAIGDRVANAARAAEPLDAAQPAVKPPATATAPPLPPARPAAAPAPAPAIQNAANTDPAAVKRRKHTTEDELLQKVALAPEAGLTAADVAPLLQGYKTSFQVSGGTNFEPDVLLRQRPDFAGLPIRSGGACRLTDRAAAHLQTLSQKLHQHLALVAPKNFDGKHLHAGLLREALQKEKRGKQPEWLRAEALPTLLQLLMHEDQTLRLILVDLLAEIKDRPASVALAQRAVFDLSPEVRAAALAALKARPSEDYQHVFFYGLRYPWEPVADHAAEALVALNDRTAVPQLVSLLKEPDPCAPHQVNRRQTLLNEVVRLKHVENCLTCHPPAFTPGEPVPGPVPGVSLSRLVPPGTPTGGVSPPAAPAGGGYGGGGTVRSGGKSSPSVVETPLLIRADITYLRQDFSVQLPLPRFGIFLPTLLRFDYVVRTRVLGPQEAAHLKKQFGDKPTYEQREAVLFALRELTGKDAGDKTEDWLRLFPNAVADAEAARLGTTLLQATPARREQLLQKWKDSDGAASCEALAWAAPRLTGVWQDRARETLIARLSRQPAAALRERLRDEDAEIRRAAILAVVRNEEAALVPDLITRLEDPEPLLGQLARSGLQNLTSQDFGPAADAAPEERAEAVAEWKAWCKNHP